jgi:hypothetical protein
LARVKRRANQFWVDTYNHRRVADLETAIRQHAPASDSQPVIFFNATTRLGGISLNAGYSLLASWSLRLSGIPVQYYACRSGLSRCVLGTNRDAPDRQPPCQECIAQSQALYPAHLLRWFENKPVPEVIQATAGLTVADLEQYTWQGIPLGQLVLPALRWILRRHHLENVSTAARFYRDYICSAASLAQDFSEMLDQVQPRAVVVFNGQFYPEATVRWVAMARGLPVISHEVGLRPFTSFFTTGEATAYPINIPDSFQLTPDQSEKLDAYLAERFKGNFTMAGIRFWPEMKPIGPEFWARTAAYQQIVPIFTNVIFDTSQGHANVLYPHMFAWLDQVLEIIRRHPETFFVIRAHPDETRPGKQALESVANWVQASGAEQQPNLLFVKSDEYFSSYELIQKSKFTMVYNSTIGLEASLLGAPVLCAGKARFTQLPTVFFPASAAEFVAQAEAFLAADKIEVPPEFKQHARRFLYTQLYRSSLPFGDFLKEDGVRQGYVTFTNFDWQALLPQNSPTLRVIHDGILEQKDFLL